MLENDYHQTNMDVEVFVRALNDARSELHAVEARLAELEPLRHRKANLEAFITIAAELIGQPQLASKPQSESVAPMMRIGTGRDDKDKIWEMIHIIMQLAKRPLTAGEVLEALEHEKFQVDGVHKRENVRGAMSRKEDVFEKVGRGLFALREWPQELKRSRDSEMVDEAAE